MLSFNSDIVIKGKKAEKYQELNARFGNKDVFTFIDIYMMSGILGYLSKKKDINEADSNATANIPRTVLNSRSEKIDFLCELITLEEELDVSEEQAMKLAFEDAPANSKEKLHRFESFNDYAMGGVDVLYNMLLNEKKYDDPVDSFKATLDMYLPNKDINKKTADEIFDEVGL